MSRVLLLDEIVEGKLSVLVLQSSESERRKSDEDKGSQEIGGVREKKSGSARRFLKPRRTGSALVMLLFVSRERRAAPICVALLSLFRVWASCEKQS